MLQLLGLSPINLVWPEQIHGKKIAQVAQVCRRKIVSRADGLIYRRGGRGRIVLTVHVADCVPLLFADPESGVIGAVHAGWRGTLGGISAEMIARMQRLGAKAEKILVVLGPHIKNCCYDVPPQRARQFLRFFGAEEDVVRASGEKWYLDLGAANKRQLIASGVLPQHIDILPYCTSCQADNFFSYRKNSRENFGEIMALIASV